MDPTFGLAAGAGHHMHIDEYLSHPASGCSRLDMDEAFHGVCFGQLLCDDDGGALIDSSGQVSSNAGAIEGGVGMDGGPLAFLGVGTGDDVFDAGLLDAALAFTSSELGVGDGGAAVSSGAMLSTYTGNVSSGESNNYDSGGGGGHDAEVVSPASIFIMSSPTTTAAPPPPPLTFPHLAPSNYQQQTAAAAAQYHVRRKLVSDGYPATAIATTTTTTAAPPPPPAAGVKRRAAAATTSISFGGSHGAHVVARDRDPRAAAASPGGCGDEPDMEAMAQVKEMVYRAAAMRPVNLGPEAAAAAVEEMKPRRRRNVRVSSDPQTVAARLRRERVSERLHVLRRLVPGGSKMDTASMLDEAASYLKFLKAQVHALETLGTSTNTNNTASSWSQQQYNYYGSGRNNPSGFFQLGTM